MSEDQYLSLSDDYEVWFPKSPRKHKLVDRSIDVDPNRKNEMLAPTMEFELLLRPVETGDRVGPTTKGKMIIILNLQSGRKRAYSHIPSHDCFPYVRILVV